MKVGAVLANVDELLHRQVNPRFVVAGRITSEAFQPTKKDKGMLSVNRGSLQSAQEAHQVFVARGWASWGTLSASVAEVKAESLEGREAPLNVAVDPDDGFDDVSHAVIDFTSLKENRKHIEKRARKLRDAAVARGAYQAEPASPQQTARSIATGSIPYEIVSDSLPVLRAAESPPATGATDDPSDPSE